MNSKEILFKEAREEFINKSIEKYGGMLMYNNFIYNGAKAPAVVTCKKHGNFTIIPMAFLKRADSSSPCPDCIHDEKFRRFIFMSHEAHGNKYDYSKVDFVNTNREVEIICPIHGSFFQKPYQHYGKKNRCYQCAKDTEKNTTHYFIKMSKDRHGNKYDYSKSIYINNKTKIEIICPVHGSFFQRPGSHFLDGHGCNKCIRDKSKLGTKKFIEVSMSIHGNKYGYENVVYIGNKNKVEIKCYKHGSFFQKPNSHMSGQGCPKCLNSKGENKISSFLDKHNIEYIREYKIDGYKYRYDFYLPKQNILIEFNGHQHYFPVKRFGGEEGFKACRIRDIRKKQIATKKKMPLIVIHYKFYYNGQLEQKLINEFKKKYNYWLKINNEIITIENSFKLCQYFKMPSSTLLRDAAEIIVKNNKHISRLF